MPDIVDEIDRLHAKATKGPVRRCEGSGSIESVDGVFIASGTWPDEGDLYVALRNHWPAIRDRLREAERERDGWKWASEKNGDAMSGYQSRAIVAEQRLVEAERKEADSDTLRNRMDAILTETANALKGEPQPDTAHSWHDLPLLAGIAVANEKQRAIDEAFKVLDSGHGMLACREAAHILRPHATEATEGQIRTAAHYTRAEARITQLESDLERANRPWSVKLSMGDAVDHFAHAECELVDTGHSDRVLIVRCQEAEARIGRLAELARREHYTCEDSWYSCPKSPEGCARVGDTDCTCGADYINAEVAKLCDAHNDLAPPAKEDSDG